MKKIIFFSLSKIKVKLSELILYLIESSFSFSLSHNIFHNFSFIIIYLLSLKIKFTKYCEVLNSICFIFFILFNLFKS